MQFVHILASSIATAPLMVLGTVTFDVYLGADQPGECTGENLGYVTQADGTGGPNTFINAACILVETADACCSAMLFRRSNW